MKRIMVYIVVAVVVMAAGGCGGDADMRNALLSADSLIYSHPDSAEVNAIIDH